MSGKSTKPATARGAATPSVQADEVTETENAEAKPRDMGDEVGEGDAEEKNKEAQKDNEETADDIDEEEDGSGGE